MTSLLDDGVTTCTRSWLHELRAHAEAPRPASSAGTIADAIERIGSGPVGWACELGQVMAASIIDQIPELGGGTEQFETLRMGTESQAIRCLLMIAGRAEPSWSAITEEALAGVGEFVRRGITLDRVLRAIRLGHSQLAKAFMVASENVLPVTVRIEEVQTISDLLFDFIDEFAAALASKYLAEREQWMASAAAARNRVVRRILAGEPVDPVAAQRALGYDPTRQNVAISLWFSPPRNNGDIAELQTAALGVLKALGAIERLIVPIGAGQVWAWAARREFVTPFDLASARPAKPDIRVAVGTPADGLEGFRRSHNEALAAERSSRATDPFREGWLTDYADDAIPALLSADVDAARDLVQRELGPLSEGNVHAAVLRETLLSYFDEESSPFAAAKRLHVSRNTVSYRVKRASELLGYDIAERRYQLHTALILADRFATKVLRHS